MVYKKHKIFAFSLALILCTFAISHGAFAAITDESKGNVGKTYTLLEPLPCVPTDTAPCPNAYITKVDLGNFFQYAFNLLIALAAAAAVFMIVWGGFQYITTDSWQGKSGGKQKFVDAIVGLIMVLVAYLILKTVNPALVNIPKSIEPLKTSPTDTQSPVDTYDSSMSASGFTNASGQVYKDNVEKDNVKLTTLKSEKADIQAQLDGMASQNFTDSSQYKDLQTQLEQKNQEIRDTNADIVVNNAKINMEANLNMVDQVFTESSGQLSQKDISKLVDQANKINDNLVNINSTKLDTLGTYDQKTKVTDYANYAKYDLQILAIKGMIQNNIQIKDTKNPSSDRFTVLTSQLMSIKSSYSSITDPDLKAKLDSTYHDVTQLLNSTE